MGRKILSRLAVNPALAEQLLTGLSHRANVRTGTGLSKSAELQSGSPHSQEPGAEVSTQCRKRIVQLQMDQFHVLADWYHFGILSLAETEGFEDDPNWISRRLGIKVQEAKAALDRLERLHLFVRDANGRLALTGKNFTTTQDIADLSIQKAHHQNIELAKEALDRSNVMHRDFSNISMSIDPEKLPQAKVMITRFRRELAEFLESGRKSEVYRLSVQLFPLSHVVTEDTHADAEGATENRTEENRIETASQEVVGV